MYQRGFITDLDNKYKGRGGNWVIGAIIGDIVGSRFEFNNHRDKDFELFTEDCRVTDDSIMTLAVAKAIMETEKIIKPLTGGYNSDYYTLIEKMTIKYMQEIGRKYPNCGYGTMFSKWILSDDPQPYYSFGNGAAMRISPVGFAARTESEACRLSEAVTGVTHNHHEGLKGAEATAVAIYMARIGSTKKEIRERIELNYYSLDFTIDEIRDSYQFNETCQDTVPQGIEAFLESTSFEDAIRNAISIGGDSDTLAAITGAIAEAYYGVPGIIKEKAFSYLDDELLSIVDDWSKFIGNEST
jgi:ADP-ribosyl-[dinitrogen reductase] hydrolase